jgi:hypothetical protein
MKPILHLKLWLIVLFWVLVTPIPSIAANNEKVLTTVYHPAAIGPADVTGVVSVTLTVPLNFKGSLDLSQDLDIYYNTSKYTSAVASFNFGAIAEVDGEPLIMTVTYQKRGSEALYTTNYTIRVVREKYTPPVFSGTIYKTFTLPGPLLFSAGDFTEKYFPNHGAGLGSIAITGVNPPFGRFNLGDNEYSLGDRISISEIRDGKLGFTAWGEGTVSYLVTAYPSDDPVNPAGTAVIKIAVSRATSGGTVTCTTKHNTPVRLNASDFMNTFQAATGSSLAHVVFKLPSATYGKLYYNYTSPSSYDTLVSAKDEYYPDKSPSISYVTFVPKDGFKGTASINYTAYSTDAVAYPGILKITVEDIGTGGSVNISTKEGIPVRLNAADLNAVFQTATGKPLSYVKFKLPSASHGKLYYNYISPAKYDSVVSASKIYYSHESPFINNITFVPKTGYKGKVSISYTACTSDGTAYACTLEINVEQISDGGAVYLKTQDDTPVRLNAADFEAAFQAATGLPLSYVKFNLPSASHGKLYYNYISPSNCGDLVSAHDIYYLNKSPGIIDVTFVPKAGYSGTVSINYTAYSVDDIPYTGILQIKVTKGSSDGVVTYNAEKNSVINLKAADFNNAFKNATNSSLSYITFRLPSSSYGTLYYNYSSTVKYDCLVSSQMKLYGSGSPSISKVSFVPAIDYTGTVSITYTGFNSQGFHYTGKLEIIFTDNYDDGTITYSTEKNTGVRMKPSDFSREFQNLTDRSLSYVIFRLPSASHGKLYYNYSSSSRENTEVSAKEKYYRAASPYLANIWFVPKTGYTGTVTINYTGYTSDGDSYSGKVKIIVYDSSDDINTITYSTDMNTAITFEEADFKRVIGSSLSYVRFKLPPASQGTLYYNYTSLNQYDAPVSAKTRYYIGESPYLSKVTFVPKTNYTGTVTLEYTGYTSHGISYDRTLKIIISAGRADGNVTYWMDKDTDLKLEAYDFSTAFERLTGLSLSYIQFKLPPLSEGRLYYKYYNSTSYDSLVSGDIKYYRSGSPSISDITFVPQKGKTGTVVIDFTGYAADGSSHNGDLIIHISHQNDGGTVECTIERNQVLTLDGFQFSQVFQKATGSSLSAVKFTLPSPFYGKLYYNYSSLSDFNTPVSGGTKYYRIGSPNISDISFVPHNNYTGTVSIIYTAYSDEGKMYTSNLKVNIIDVPDRSQYFYDVDTSFSWAAQAIDYLYKEKVVNGTGSGVYSPALYITRGDFMLMLYRGLQLEGPTESNFSDVDENSYYYKAIAVAKSLGIAQGDGERFNPGSPITREDAMVLLVRSLEATGQGLGLANGTDLQSFTDYEAISGYSCSIIPSYFSFPLPGFLPNHRSLPVIYSIHRLN